MEPKQHHFNVNSKVVCIIFQVVSGVLVCIRMLVALDSFCLALHLRLCLTATCRVTHRHLSN